MNRTKMSRFLSYVLRHDPDAIGITLDEHGWASVSELIDGMSQGYPPMTMKMLEEIVRKDAKGRYAFNEDKTLIRANQGHSIPVDVEMAEETPPEFLWHGTATRFARSIEANGLLPKSRLYVHLSSDAETAVKVGRRHGKALVYRVRSGDMARDGFIFYRSANGVWQTKVVPTKYLEKES